MKEWHLIGNGDQATLFQEQERKGKILVCNMPPFELDPKKVYGSCMVDFKMMQALTEGSVNIDHFMWVLGTRPRIWMYERSAFYMKYAPNIKEFYTHVPEYAYNPTNFNCGHMAAHYLANRHKADKIHLYGFDTLFDFNMRSITDLYLSSDRTDTNNYRLLNIWRPIWRDIIREFPNTEFVFHHNHDKMKIPKLDNMTNVVYDKQLSRNQRKKDESDISDGRGMDQQQVEPGQVPELALNRKQRRMAAAFARKGGYPDNML